MQAVEHTTTCPFCGHLCNLASPARSRDDGWSPRDGDVSFCIRCGEVGVFDRTVDIGARKPNEEEQAIFDSDPSIDELKTAWHAVKRAGKGW